MEQGRLLREGVLVGGRPVVAGEGPFADAFAEAARAEGATVERVPLAAIEGVRGLSSVRTVVVRDGRGERRLDADALVIDAPVAPSFEVAAGAGAAVAHGEDGYRVVVDDALAARGPRALFALGEVVGAAFDLDAMRAAADRLVAQLGAAP